MMPEQRLDRVETITSIQELRDVQHRDHKIWAPHMEELREAQAATDEKLHILIDTVDLLLN